MTYLTKAARGELAKDMELRALLGRSSSWETWIFDERPMGVVVENTSRCMIVLNHGPSWTSSNEHNTMRFPTLIVDIWADPDRHPNKSIAHWNATRKIEDIQAVVDKHFHLMDVPGGLIRWGSDAQLAAGEGVAVAGSKRRGTEPDFSPITDTEGAFRGRLQYNVNLP